MTIDERCRKLPVVKSQKCSWKGGERRNDGATLSYPVYSDGVRDWIRAFYELELADQNYVEHYQNLHNKRIAEMNRDEILTCMTALIRGERFCDGLIASALEDGSLEELSERLNSLTRP